MNLDGIAAGQTVSHYRLLGKIGEGGMGVVFAAEDVQLGRQVAIKFLGVARNRRLSRARFLREARSASVLNHPNVATVYDYGEREDGRPFIVMELLRGQTLSDVLNAERMTVERSVHVVRSVLAALIEAHLQGIIHRDVKPSNIVLGEQGSVKVLDFGLAKSLADEGTGGASAAAATSETGYAVGVASADLPTQTLNGVVLGTPLYVSPEQATGATVDERADLFSVGAVLYECLAGRPAFGAPSVVEIFAQVVSPVQPPPPSSYNPSVPAMLDRITLKALAKSPGERYQSAQEFLDDLSRIESGSGADRERQVLGPSLDFLYRWIVSHGCESRSSARRRWVPAPPASKARRPRRTLVLVLLVCVVTVGSALIGLRFQRPRAPVNALAVLPFVNETQDQGADDVIEDVTDALITSLGRQSGLKVISRNSVNKYKGQQVDAVVVSADLGVQAVLTGRVSRSGEKLRVLIELIDARDRSRIWGGQYFMSPTDLLTLKETITREVIEKLRGGSGGEGKDMTTNRHEVNQLAYDHYIKGRRQWNKRTGDALRLAIEHFQQASEIDPDFALAYAGLADAYVLAGGIKPRESYLRAKAAAAKALELDPTLGEAYATLGFIKTHYESDWTNAEADFKRAIEFSPNYATAHHWYAAHLLARSRYDEALAELRKAQELDPLSPIINTDIGLFYFYQRRYGEAVGYLEKNRDMFPLFFPAHYYLGWAYMQDGRYAEAAASYEQALTLSKRHTMVLAMLGYSHVLAGRQSEARAILAELQERAKHQYVSPYRFAVLYTGLGEKDTAFQWLNKAYDEQDLLLIYVNINPFSDTLRQDPRFGELLHKLGLG